MADALSRLIDALEPQLSSTRGPGEAVDVETGEVVGTVHGGVPDSPDAVWVRDGYGKQFWQALTELYWERHRA